MTRIWRIIADLAENKSTTIRSIRVIRVLFLLPRGWQFPRDPTRHLGAISSISITELPP